MNEDRRNSWSGLLVLFFMFGFFSFVHWEKETHVTGNPYPSSIVIGITNSGIQAIIGPSTPTPLSGYCWVKTHSAKFACLDCPAGRDFIFNKQTSSYFSSYKLQFRLNKPKTGLIFLQKIPGRENEDGIPPVI